jgi:hypothetical protein
LRTLPPAHTAAPVPPLPPQACPCFGLARECDPDLCVQCQCDPLVQDAINCTAAVASAAAATVDSGANGGGGSAGGGEVISCLNNSLMWRRHKRVLLASSDIQGAGWGAFAHREIKKGDFVCEYLGERISQSEADRRGPMYDVRNR